MRRTVYEGGDIGSLADTIAQRLLAEGFTVHRYDSFSTSSIYLKLDYGLACSIRISDHPGKPYPYRFNIGPWIEWREDQYFRGIIQSYYTINDLESLIADVIRERWTKKRLHGERGYKRRMDDLKAKRDRGRGFWQAAYRVKK